MKRLLLIEDDGDVRTLLERYLRRSDYEVVTAVDGEEGLRVFFHGDFDIVLVDGLLPKKNGYEVTAGIRAMPKGAATKIVMITAAFRTPRAKKEALEGGVDAFFTKPFVLNDLRATLKELTQPAPLTPPRPPAAGDTIELARPAHTPPPPTAPPLPSEQPVSSPAEVAALLLACARHRLSGTVQLGAGASSLTIVFLQGVVVGAGDNLREELLGERLWRQGRLTTEQMRALNQRMNTRGERVGEALLALGLCSAEEMLATMAAQTRARVRRALLWNGTARIVDDAADAHFRAVDAVDLPEVILAFGLEEAQQKDAAAFVEQHADARLVRGSCFEQLLASLARVHGQATLPGVMLAYPDGVTVKAAATASSASEVFAACLAGLALAGDASAERDTRSLPDVLRLDLGNALVDRELANRIGALLLKARGRSIYGFLGLPRDSDAALIKQQIDALLGELGPDAIMGRSLGPVMSAARELWAYLDDAAVTVADPVGRLLYDAGIESQMTASLTVPSASPEDAFLEGQLALSGGDAGRARGCFERALQARPRDAEYASHLGWSEILSGDAAGGVQRLVKLMREHPQSMRPMFFLGLHTARVGEIHKARALLEEAVRRSPHDVEVRAALSALD